MLKCPACGRVGGPFRLCRQAVADGQLIRSWCCPCGMAFYALAGAERTPGIHGPYTGFSVEWNGRCIRVRLEKIGRHEVSWAMGPWRLVVAGPLTGPGSRQITLLTAAGDPLAEWRLEPGWGAAEILRRIRGQPLPGGLEPEPLARILHRLLN
ncbi:MAG TPA: hypothetical protein VIL07_11305 [Symbiobacteriaceae bacterium]